MAHLLTTQSKIFGIIAFMLLSYAVPLALAIGETEQERSILQKIAATPKEEYETLDSLYLELENVYGRENRRHLIEPELLGEVQQAKASGDTMALAYAEMRLGDYWEALQPEKALTHLRIAESLFRSKGFKKATLPWRLKEAIDGCLRDLRRYDLRKVWLERMAPGYNLAATALWNQPALVFNLLKVMTGCLLVFRLGGPNWIAKLIPFFSSLIVGLLCGLSVTSLWAPLASSQEDAEIMYLQSFTYVLLPLLSEILWWRLFQQPWRLTLSILVPSYLLPVCVIAHDPWLIIQHEYW